MTAPSDAHFKRQYPAHLKHLRLKGLQSKTIDAYARAIRRVGGYFNGQIDELSEAQLLDYFTDRAQRRAYDRSQSPLLELGHSRLLGRPRLACPTLTFNARSISPRNRSLPSGVPVCRRARISSMCCSST